MRSVLMLACLVLTRSLSTVKPSSGRQALSLTIKSILGARFRLDRVLSNRGVAPRTGVEGLLRQGRVLVDGEVVRRTGHKVTYGASITVDDEPVLETPLLALYNKPVGVHSTMKDPHGRSDLSFLQHLHPVGRLDADTSGLLLLSSNGKLSSLLLDPSVGLPRVYDAIVNGTVDATALGASLRAGVETSAGTFRAELLHSRTLSGNMCADALVRIEKQVSVLGKEQNEVERAYREGISSLSYIRLSVREGKYRMVRRMLHNAGHSVLLLHRQCYGGLSLASPLQPLSDLDEPFVWPPASAVPEDEEVEIKVIDAVMVLSTSGGSSEELLSPSLLILTNFRLLVLAQGGTSSSGYALHLQEVASGEDCAGFLRRSTRARILFHLPKQSKKDLVLKFTQGGKEEFLEALRRTLGKRSWENVSPSKVTSPVTLAGPTSAASATAGSAKAVSPPPPPVSFSAAHAGVGGIIRKQEESLGSVDALTRTALSDLDALMKSAREVISVVQRYSALVAAERENANDDMSETSSQVAETNEMESILQSIGMVSPITKTTAGRLYHEQLARQIADVLLHDGRLARLGGLVTLTDLYCLFNRARGTALVSPEDLLAAAQRMDRLALGMRLRRFPSGVLALQLDAFSDERSTKRLADMIQSSYEANRGQGVTAYEAARFLGGSLSLTKELLQLAEQRGLLCRDDSLRGLFYYPNLFPHYAHSLGS